MASGDKGDASRASSGSVDDGGAHQQWRYSLPSLASLRLYFLMPFVPNVMAGALMMRGSIEEVQTATVCAGFGLAGGLPMMVDCWQSKGCV